MLECGRGKLFVEMKNFDCGLVCVMLLGEARI